LRAGDWRTNFRLDDVWTRWPALAAIAWYVALLAIGLLAFPIVAVALRDFPDRGWAVSRTAGLLVTSWLAWMVASVTPVPHVPALVAAAAAVVGLAGAAIARADADGWRAWLRRRWRLLLVEEAVFAALFAAFLAIRVANPDLWHPYYGGEKPMDFAYFNAVLRSVSFPPYDPWFAGGKMNYYYYGFVFVGALAKLTGVVPWIAYNLILPSLAAMTGLGVFGVVVAWTRALGRSEPLALRAGALGAVLAVVSGNLHQVKFIARKLAELSTLQMESVIPGLPTVVRAVDGWRAVICGGLPERLSELAVCANAATLHVATGDWYWKASRAIATPSTDVEPITEFPFFTFLYADLHAHMMALPLTVLALALALSWPLAAARRRAGCSPETGVARMLLAALAIGALWPANTWDYPTYGLVAAGAIAVGAWGPRPRLSLGWAGAVAAKGLALLGLSLLLFLPYHRAYVQPYGEFGLWEASRTGVDSYLTVHGIFLFAIVTWGLARLVAAFRAGLRRRRDRLEALYLLGALLAVLAVLAVARLWVPLVGAIVVAGGLALLLRPTARPVERFAGWIAVLGVACTLFVEYVVLQGDIGRMNTVFKFYIQVWVLWATLAAVAVAWLAPYLRRRGGGAWAAAFAILVAAGLVYPVTATRAKVADRFPAAPNMPAAEREGYDARLGPSLSGTAYEEYAYYDDDGQALRLAADAAAFRWLLANVEGTPVILEGYRDKAYRWGSRYSIHTGLPTVIGWDWHQKQQRNAVGGTHIDERVAAVRTMYNTPDPAQAESLLDLYRVEYVIVGEMERAFYDPAGIAKFDAMVAAGDAEEVYRGDDGRVQIYRIIRDAGAERPVVPGMWSWPADDAPLPDFAP
jgi:YYY domain-containing protein